MVLVLVLCAATHARAQTRAELQARAAAHRARIDSLLPLQEQARAQAVRATLERQRAAAERIGKLDTAQAGPFLVVGRADDVAAATPVFERTWDEFAGLVGAAGERLNGSVFVVRGDDGETGLHGLYGRPRHYLVDLPSIIRYRDRARVVRAAIGNPLRELLPPAVQQWIGEGNFGAGREMDRAYRELAIGDAQGTEMCHDGDLASCMSVLGLTADTDWVKFYTAAQIREKVRRSRGGGTDYVDCVEMHVHPACVAIIARGGFTVLPLSHHTRVVLLEHALLRGGDGSFERMIADSTADVRSALTTASRSELTPLLSSWRETVLAARPTPAAWLGGTLIVTLFWIGVLVMLAKRSTRWRIG